MTGRTRKPRIFPAGSPEPRDVEQVKGIAITWERREDGKWHSTWPGIVKSYPWPQLNWYVLSEVVSGG